MSSQSTWKPIVKTRWKTSYMCSCALPKETRQAIHYAISYIFLLPPGHYTYAELAAAIEKAYDYQQPRNAEVIRILRSIEPE